jgi:di/tricarboxylate transporter
MVWGRWRYDLVAFSALAVAVIAGVVPIEEAFSGFGHPATVIIAMVLIVSRESALNKNTYSALQAADFFL